MQVGKFMFQLDQGMIGPGDVSRAAGAGAEALCRRHHGPDHLRMLAHPEIIVRAPDHHLAPTVRRVPDRSEEHTSELQSRLHLVCRLLLEKKKKKKLSHILFKIMNFTNKKF